MHSKGFVLRKEDYTDAEKTKPERDDKESIGVY